jgi:hypothetical protein
MFGQNVPGTCRVLVKHVGSHPRCQRDQSRATATHGEGRFESLPETIRRIDSTVSRRGMTLLLPEGMAERDA